MFPFAHSYMPQRLVPGMENFEKATVRVVDLAILAVLEISANLLKYPTFEGVFFQVFMGKNGKKLEFLHFVSSALKS
jgi:hypothetical protein